MNATNAHTPGSDFPATLAFDPENAVLAGAGNGWFSAIACDSTLHRGGVGAEIARRWNANPALLAALEWALEQLPVPSDTRHLFTAEYLSAHDSASAVRRLARGAS